MPSLLPATNPEPTLRRRRRALVMTPELTALFAELSGDEATVPPFKTPKREQRRRRRRGLLPLSPRELRQLRDELDLAIGKGENPFATWTVDNTDHAGVIGTGATASVLMCTNRHNPKKRCALKKISLRHPLAMSYSGTTSRSAVRQELHVLQRLNATPHPNLLRLIEAYEWEGCAYLALELAKGGDLFTAANAKIASGTQWSEGALRSIATELLTAVAHTHALGVAHRDVKPENVLFRDAEGASRGTGVILADWGTAAIVADATSVTGLRCARTPLTMHCRRGAGWSSAEEPEELERNDTANGTPLFLAPELMPLFRADPTSLRQMPTSLLAMADGVRRRASSVASSSAYERDIERRSRSTNDMLLTHSGHGRLCDGGAVSLRRGTKGAGCGSAVVPRQPGDVWGVGIVLYVCALLRFPSFDELGDVDVERALDPRLGLGDDVHAPAGLRELIRQLLAVEAEERPTALEALSNAWLCGGCGGGGGEEDMLHVYADWTEEMEKEEEEEGDTEKEEDSNDSLSTFSRWAATEERDEQVSL